MSVDNEIPNASERLAAIPEPPAEALATLAGRPRRDRRIHVLLIFASLGAALGLLAAAIAIGGRDDAKQRADRNAHAASAAQSQADTAVKNTDALSKGLAEANQRLRALGKPTIPVPTLTPVSPPVIVDGLTPSQEAAVRGIISADLLRYRPTLTAAEVQQISRTAATLVPKPKDGKTPTSAELQPLITASLAAYCTGDRCNGGEGKPGAQGSPGQPGAAGSPAPPVTDEQLRPLIVAQFTAYCGQDSRPCDGKVGPRGEDGQPGRSVVDTDCVSEELGGSHWVITYDRPINGSYTQDVPGPCRIVVLPSPEPSAARTR